MFLLFFFVGSLQAVCPPGWLAWQDSCCIFMPHSMYWNQAEETCRRLGANLVVPNSKIEQDFVWQKLSIHLEMLDIEDKRMWIGCNMTSGNLKCIGVDGDPAYKNWDTDQPNLQDGCVRMTDKNADGKWRNAGCSGSKYFACEMAVPCGRAAMQFSLVPQSCLFNHLIKSYPVKESIGCGLACWAEPLCCSFNLWKQAGDSKMCQLNNATLLNADDVTDIKNEDNCFFYE
ncbi:snaclec agglucetin subunit alpha-2-like [Asterias amurensis]|uniref:snaclec agglucetin subunit alpha-2-like n=1 Tax=Asterias amurensis TaxID=7602 RepID=UPI003AB7C84A